MAEQRSRGCACLVFISHYATLRHLALNVYIIIGTGDRGTGTRVLVLPSTSSGSALVVAEAPEPVEGVEVTNKNPVPSPQSQVPILYIGRKSSFCLHIIKISENHSMTSYNGTSHFSLLTHHLIFVCRCRLSLCCIVYRH